MGVASTVTALPLLLDERNITRTTRGIKDKAEVKEISKQARRGSISRSRYPCGSKSERMYVTTVKISWTWLVSR
jgi:hypothetical protein